MASTRQAPKRVPLWPWLMLLAWVCVIWGHSLMPGSSSSMESGMVVEAIKRVVYALDLADNPYVARVMNDPSLFSHIVRKTAHFTEYFILGILSFNALRLTFRNPLLGCTALAALWVSVPSIDEFIQRFVPERAGRVTDVLLDMSGFATSFLLCLLFSALARAIRGPSR